jgi:hypothetical protein
MGAWGAVRAGLKEMKNKERKGGKNKEGRKEGGKEGKRGVAQAQFGFGEGGDCPFIFLVPG